MKKFIVSVLLIITVLITSISALGYDNVYTYTEGDIEIMIEYNGLNDSQLCAIVSHFIGETSNETETMGLMCTLFGHKMEYSSVNVTDHNYYSTVPHCRMVTYNVGVCQRCDHTEYEVIKETRLACH